MSVTLTIFVKSKPVGVNFINIKRANFSYERLFKAKTKLEKRRLCEKFVCFTLMKLTPVGEGENSVEDHVDEKFLPNQFVNRSAPFQKKLEKGANTFTGEN